MGGLRKNHKEETEERQPKFILKNKKDRKVWHEQFDSRAEAQAKIDYERNMNGIDGGWVIEEV